MTVWYSVRACDHCDVWEGGAPRDCSCEYIPWYSPISEVKYVAIFGSSPAAGWANDEIVGTGVGAAVAYWLAFRHTMFALLTKSLIVKVIAVGVAVGDTAGAEVAPP